MRVSKPMDFTILQMKFGEDTKWTVKYKCAWCEKPLSNQTEEKYKQYGNICSRCNVDKSQPSMTSLEIIRTKKRIVEHREVMESLAAGLEFDITEAERQLIEFKMEEEFNKIKALKYFLCQGEN